MTKENAIGEACCEKCYHMHCRLTDITTSNIPCFCECHAKPIKSKYEKVKKFHEKSLERMNAKQEKDATVWFSGETKECKCACHENKLKKPYGHDTKCCENMNGFIEPKEQEWEYKFLAIECLKKLTLAEVGKIFCFIRQLLQQAQESAYKEWKRVNGCKQCFHICHDKNVFEKRVKEAEERAEKRAYDLGVKQREAEILEIVKNSRTINENLGVGQTEEQTRAQIVVDIIKSKTL